MYLNFIRESFNAETIHCDFICKYTRHVANCAKSKFLYAIKRFVEKKKKIADEGNICFLIIPSFLAINCTFNLSNSILSKSTLHLTFKTLLH